MNRFTLHDDARCRLVVEVKAGLVVITLWFGPAPGRSFDCYQTTNLAPEVARDRVMFARAIAAAEFTAGCEPDTQHTRQTPLDRVHAAIKTITRRPSA